MRSDKLNRRSARILSIAVGLVIASTAGAADEFTARLERLRKESPGEFDKVQKLMKVDREAATQFLRERFPQVPANTKETASVSKSGSDHAARTKKKAAAAPLPPRLELSTKIGTLLVGEFAVDLCQREDGAFGLGEIRRGRLLLRRSDFLITYRDFIMAGARRLLVEGDASVFGSYAIAIGDDWEKQWGKVPDPDLYYGATLAAVSINPRFYLAHFRRYVAAGAPWIMNWDFLFSEKLSGPEIDDARREVHEVVRAYGRVSDRMVHRFVHADGSGYTWTNDRDSTKIVWLLKDTLLPNGHRGEAGQVYVIQ